MGKYYWILCLLSLLLQLLKHGSIITWAVCGHSIIVEQNWFAKNGMKHRDTKTQSFIFWENRVHRVKVWLYGLYLLYIFISPCLCVQYKGLTDFSQSISDWLYFICKWFVYEITSITIFDISAIVCRLYNKGRKSKNSLERTDYSGINRFAIGKADK